MSQREAPLKKISPLCGLIFCLFVSLLVHFAFLIQPFNDQPGTPVRKNELITATLRGQPNVAQPVNKPDDLNKSVTIPDTDSLANSNVMRTLVTPPRPRVLGPLIYPVAPFINRVSGKVTLEILISAEGLPLSIKIVEAHPTGTFDQAAIEAVANTIFHPGTLNGIPTESRKTIEIVFDPNEWESEVQNAEMNFSEVRPAGEN